MGESAGGGSVTEAVAVTDLWGILVGLVQSLTLGQN